MPLSNNQILRLEQLEIPRWVTRNVAEELALDDKLVSEKPVDDYKILLSKGDNPVIFWLIKEASQLPSEKFMEDVSIAIKGLNTGWQVLCGDLSQLQKNIVESNDKPVCMVLNEVITTIELQTEVNSINIQIPVNTSVNASLKKDLWNTIRQIIS